VGLVSGERKRYLLQNATCLVVPSRLWEGMPLVVLEGFAAGRPVIASQLVGMDDVISDGQTGFLVPPGSPEALAAQLEAALRNPAQMDICGARAHAVAAAYGWDAIAARHLHLYAELRTAASHGPQSEVPLTSGRS
jgi:glycosyltransferase involved in cell wall biosynthesis